MVNAFITVMGISQPKISQNIFVKNIFPPFSRIFSFRIAQFYFENKILQIYADVLKSFIQETDIKKVFYRFIKFL